MNFGDDTRDPANAEVELRWLRAERNAALSRLDVATTIIADADKLIPKPHEGQCSWDCSIECDARNEWRRLVRAWRESTE